MSAPTVTAPSAPTVADLAVRPSWKTPIAFGLLALVALITFGILGESGETSTFGISTSSDAWQIDPLALSS
ncbi:simple sugar transport system permease protein, partial [Jiangella alba]